MNGEIFLCHLFFKIFFIHLRETEREQVRAEAEGEGEADFQPSREPDVGLDPSGITI